MHSITAFTYFYSASGPACCVVALNVLGWRAVDTGGGWPTYALPPAKLAIHPAKSSSAELYLMCDDFAATVRRLRKKGVAFKAGIVDQGWGLLASAKLPAAR
jgi:hypothetical protein